MEGINMNYLELTKDILKKRGRECETLASSPLTTPTFDQMKAVNAFWPEAHSDVELMVKLASAAFEVVGLKGIKVPFELTVEAEAFGSTLNMGKMGRNPYVIKPAFEDVSQLTFTDDVFEKGRFDLVFKSLEILNEKYGDFLPIYPQIVGPFTLLGHLIGTEKMLRMTLKEKEAVKEGLNEVTKFNIEYGNRVMESGGNILCIADPTASGDLISPRSFKELLIPIYREIARSVKGEIILHICGNTSYFLDFIPDSGFEAYSFDSMVDVKTAKEKLGGKLALFGNVPTVEGLLNGTPEVVKELSLQALKDGIDVLCGACAIPPQAPLDNLKAMVKAADEFNEGFCR
jgi:MtaA/CmuA family methyltransferase